MTVWLVGAGPGDPGLITARGLELVRSCEVLVHDRLVAPELVAEAPGLRLSRDGMGQESLNRLLVALGSLHEVVRLKGGDPFVYGRGGEEAIALADAGVPFGVVPGVSTLAAGPAAAGIPLTHRGVSGSVRVLTGRGESDGETIVVFMGLDAVADVCERLRADGVPPSMPAAVISRATLPGQRVVEATLGTLPAAAERVPGPALLVVGEVVALRARLAELAQAA